MTEEVLHDFKNTIAGVRVVPSSGGRFEVTADGEALFSKEVSGRFPEAGEVSTALRGKLGAV